MILVAAMAAACSSTAEAIALNADEAGNALNGYDAVAYFAVNNAML